MCGRTCLSLSKEHIQCACSYKPTLSYTYIKPEWINEHNDGKEYVPSFNIAPTAVTPVLLLTSKYENSTKSTRVLKPMMWGIIPPWHKGDYKTHNLNTNNCRLENINGSKLYSPILKTGGRCIIIVEGFYEWQTTDKLTKIKQPYFIYMPQNDNMKIDESNTWNSEFIEEEGWKGVRLMYIAGLYSIWRNDNTVIYSYSVITMDSNSTLNWLHHRMPAILNTPEQIDAWLDVDNVNPYMAISYLKPNNILSWHKISPLVNYSINNSEHCKKRLTENNTKQKQKTLTAWFTNSTKRKSDDDYSSTYKQLKK